MQDSRNGSETVEGGSFKEAEATGGGGKDAADDSTLTGKDDARITEIEGKDPNEVGFDGTDDPFDPLSQPIWRKWMSVMTVSSGAICV
jgi:hypothetical protein